MINRTTELPLILNPTSVVVSAWLFLFKFLQMIKRNINNVRRMTSHPTLPYCESDSHFWVDFTSHFWSAAKKKVFVSSEVKKLKCRLLKHLKRCRMCFVFFFLPPDLTGAQDGSVRMFEWGHSQQIICFRSPGNSRVTRIRFNHQGNKVTSSRC